MIQIERLTAILFAVIALTFSYSAFAEDDERPCTEENPCEEVVVTGERQIPPNLDWPLQIREVNTDESMLPDVEDCTVQGGGGSRHPANGVQPDSDCDGIADHGDDCPDDPTNMDEECLNDLQDCDAIIGWAVTTALASGKLVKGTVLTAGTVKVGTVILAAKFGLVVIAATAGYCVIAALEG